MEDFVNVLTAYNDEVGVCLNSVTVLVVDEEGKRDVPNSSSGSKAWIDVPCNFNYQL